MTLAVAKPDLLMKGPLGTGIVNAASSEFHDVITTEAKINAAYLTAATVGAKFVYVPSCFDGYDATQIVPQAGIGLVSESELWAKGTVILDAAAFPGANGGLKIAAAAAALPAAGGTIDARRLTGAQVVTGDMLVNVTTEKPIKFLFGPSTWSCQQANFASIMTLFGSNIEVHGDETTFKLNDGQNQSYLFLTDQSAGAGTATITNGSANVTLSTPSRGVIAAYGKCIAIAGHTPNGGRDNTTLNGAIDNVTTTIVLASITGQLVTNGWIRVDNEIISYVSFSGNSLVGAIRGAFGTTAASHSNGATVDRVVYDNYTIRAVSGAVVTLDRNVTQAASGTAYPYIIGPSDCSFTGTLILDGNRPASDTAANGTAIQAWASARLRTEAGVVFQHWDHEGLITYQSQSAVIDGRFFDIGTPSLNLGFAVIFFQGSKYCTAFGDYDRVNQAITADDRTSGSQVYDNAPLGCLAFPRTIRNSGTGVRWEGSSRSYALVPYVENWGVDSDPGASVIQITAPQWVTNAPPLGNYFDIGYVTPVGQIGSLGAGTGNCFVISRTPGATVLNSGAATNVVITTENTSQPGLKLSSGIGVGIAPITGIQVASQAPTSGTQTIHQVNSPDATVVAFAPRIFNSVSAAVPVVLGANTNHAVALAVNNLNRWVVDTLGRSLPDATNGGARLERQIALVSGTTPAVDASAGNRQTLAVLTNIAVVIAVPTNPPAAGLSQDLFITIRNSSGGALTTAPTFNTGAGGFKFQAGSIVNMANGTQVEYHWRWDPVQSFFYLVTVSLAL